MDSCIFCSIVSGLLPAAKIFEDEEVLIFLDKRPLFHGHCLLIPKMHYQTLLDLPAEKTTIFFNRLQQITQVVEIAMNATGSFVALNNKVSQSVPHLHFHIVPRNAGDGLRGFFWPRHKYEPNELAETQRKLQATWQSVVQII